MEPEAYTIGWVPFLGLEIHLDSQPLIPRVETEWWTERLLGEVAKQFSGALRAARPSLTPENHFATSPLRFLDLCAGSGAIGCAALKYLPAAEVWFGEIDPAHEATIKKNIEHNGLDASRAAIKIGDLFAPFAGQQFDVIAANPPYVPDARALPSEVTDFEPARALRAGPEGLDLIRRIALELPRHLAKPHGVAWIECDSEYAEEARGAFGAAGLAAEIMHDQYDRPRVVVARAAV